MFHKSNLGRFGINLPSDIDGYVPEDGDEMGLFFFDGATEFNDESWDEFVEKAVAETKAANEKLEAWQEGN